MRSLLVAVSHWLQGKVNHPAWKPSRKRFIPSMVLKTARLGAKLNSRTMASCNTRTDDESFLLTWPCSA